MWRRTEAGDASGWLGAGVHAPSDHQGRGQPTTLTADLNLGLA